MPPLCPGAAVGPRDPAQPRAPRPPGGPCLRAPRRVRKEVGAPFFPPAAAPAPGRSPFPRAEADPREFGVWATVTAPRPSRSVVEVAQRLTRDEGAFYCSPGPPTCDVREVPGPCLAAEARLVGAMFLCPARCWVRSWVRGCGLGPGGGACGRQPAGVSLIGVSLYLPLSLSKVNTNIFKT